MEALLLLIPLSVLLVFIALWIFFRAADDGQFDDLVGPGLRVLQDDDRPRAEPSATAAASDDGYSSVRSSNSSGNSTTSSILRK